MLIHNGIITLDYDPPTDILETSMPDIKEFGASEVSFCLGLIVESIRNYDIKHLLLDSSKSVIEVEGEAYRAIMGKFAMDLMGTRLKKIARVGTTDPGREERSARVSAELRKETGLPAEYRNFTTKAGAMAWLLEQG